MRIWSRKISASTSMTSKGEVPGGDPHAAPRGIYFVPSSPVVTRQDFLAEHATLLGL